MAKALKKVRVASNPHRKPAAKKRPNAATKKGHSHHMAKNKKSYKKKANPATSHKKRRRSNPGFAGIGSAKEILTSAVAGTAGFVASSQLPQLLLQDKNTGWMGYAANVGAGVGATLLANAFAGPVAGRAAMVGSLVMLVDRLVTEHLSSIGPYLTISGVGDATAAHRMGTIRDGWYTHPNLHDGSGQMIVPDPITNAAINAIVARYPQIAAPMAQAIQQGGKVGAVNPSGMRRHTASGQLLSSRYASRFNQALN